ncbi:hemerythrin domain-containing protein [Streptacidiphilus sp. MAP12-16]|uniref:hemerythrin domain-containing protein n=1 Tax=Streptacidiphilus sp. MAP12-16 TaxID=3156300 RepID=UPI003516769C
MGHGGNVIAELTADHREVEELFEQIQALAAGDPRRGEIADRFTTSLVRHSVAEERYLYPAVREHVPGGHALADKQIADHATIEKLLKELEHSHANQAAFNALLSKVVTEVKAHVADEEERLLPALAKVCSPQQLDELGERIREAKEKAPTHPHPSVPPESKLLAPGVSLVDRVRDFMAGRGKA